MKSIDKFVLVLVASLALLLAGCGGGSSTPATPPAPPPPSAYEMAMDAINAATTPEDAQAAYDAVKDDVTAAEGEQLQMAVDDRQAALAMMARADEQKMALMDAAGMVDTSDLSTQEKVDAAREAIAGLRQAIADAVDVADTSMYQSTLDAAVEAVDEAQGGIDTATRRTNQMTGLSDASGMLLDALAALSGTTPTQALLDAANNAVAALNAAIVAGVDLTDDEKATYVREAANAAAPIDAAQVAFNDAQDKANEQANMEMMATAMKLRTGISAPSATAAAAYDTTGDGSLIGVTIGTNGPENLSEDEDATVAAHHGWEGMKFTKIVELAADGSNAASAGTYEAVVYSHVGAPTEGAKFSDTYQYNADFEDNLQLNTSPATGEATELQITGATAVASRIASPSFDQSAGSKEFEGGGSRVEVDGSYHGVSGTYYCIPTTSCSATVATDGFTLGGGTWTFKAGNADNRLMDTPDAAYASYGWWLRKSADGDTFNASAFHAYRGTDADTVDIANLRGSATYRGGAAGKYALHSTTGGTNDAGHFTARAVLEAEFGEDHTISGTIDNFMGSDGMSRDWSVALEASVVADGGAIAGDPDTTGNTDAQGATWTINGIAGEDNDNSQWSGNLREQGDDGVPGIATGTFYTEFGRDGRMVGAFGANEVE